MCVIQRIWYNKSDIIMFKVSQEIYLNSSDSANISNTYGTYKRSQDDDGSYPINERKVYVSPELTDIKKISILHFPTESLQINQVCEFTVKKNDAKGNIEAQLISPSGKKTLLCLNQTDPGRFSVRIVPSEIGNYFIHIRFNAVEIPQSPLKFEVCDESSPASTLTLPVFTSDASKIKYRGLGVQNISIHDKNEFYIDASEAGNNILFIGVCGPKGQCQEVAVKHLGQNNYYVTYRVQDHGHYLIAVKWGDDHVPDSPFSLQTD